MRYTRRTTTSHTISKVCDLRGKEEKGKREGALKEKEKEEREKREGEGGSYTVRTVLQWLHPTHTYHGRSAIG